MSEGSNSDFSNGLGFTGLLAILFIGLKLTNQISWSWWWVLSPIWIPAGLVVIVVAIMVLIYYLSDKCS